MNVSKLSSLTTALVATAVISGCSVQSGAAKIEQGFNAVASTIDKLDSPVQSEKIAENEFRLWQETNHSFKSFESTQMRVLSRELCPIGYYPVSRQARSNNELKGSDLDCLDGSCQYTLEWHIRCQDVPEEEFSLFGKT